jgi:hypothetical protein
LMVVQRRKWWRYLGSYVQFQNQISLGFPKLRPVGAAWCGSIEIGCGRDEWEQRIASQ